MVAISILALLNLSCLVNGEAVKYKVVQGDTLWSIAKRYYGQGDKWDVIFSANKDVIKNPDVIMENSIIEIPLSDSRNAKSSIFEVDNYSEVVAFDATSHLSVEQQPKHISSIEFEEVAKEISEQLPYSQTSFDISSKRIKINKKYLLSSVMPKHKSNFFLEGDKIMLSLEKKFCVLGEDVLLIKKVKDDGEYIIGDIAGYCSIENCSNSVAVCSISRCVREIREGDTALVWKEKN